MPEQQSIEFKIQEMETTIKSTNFDKALGADYFDGSVLHKSNKIKKKLYCSITRWVNIGVIHEYLNEGRMIVLSKRADHETVEADLVRALIENSHITQIVERTIKNKFLKKNPHLLTLLNQAATQDFPSHPS